LPLFVERKSMSGTAEEPLNVRLSAREARNGAEGLEIDADSPTFRSTNEVGKGFVLIKKTLRHLRANAVAYVALSIALSGTSYAAATKLLPANSVGTHQVINHSLLGRDFKAGQLPRGAKGKPGPAGPTGAN